MPTAPLRARLAEAERMAPGRPPGAGPSASAARFGSARRPLFRVRRNGLLEGDGTILFGKYELLERINVGGMAEIVRARAIEAPGQPIVAVKRILPHLIDDQQFVTMFLDESRVLESLNHEDIIRTLDVGVVDGAPYIALEYVDGKDARMLFHQCRRSGLTVPLGVACFIMAKVCDGLHAAHEHTGPDGRTLGLVHRDVSLQNVLLSYDGDVKVTDFGIAMSASNEARTEAGVVKGKFGYMSPEQIRGEALDRRSDVFAAGICLYELLTCQRLFSGESDYAAIERVRNVDIDPPSTLNRQIPSALERIVMTALSRHPRDRYQTAAEMRDALFAFVEDARIASGPRRLGAFLREQFPIEEAEQGTAVTGAPEGMRTDGARLAGTGASALDAQTGLAAFDDLEPVSALTGLEPNALVNRLDGPPQPSVRMQSSPRVPPVVPHRSSIPPPQSGGRPISRPAYAASVEWDEEELPTHGGGLQALQPLGAVPEEGFDDDDVTRQVMVERTFSGVDLADAGLGVVGSAGYGELGYGHELGQAAEDTAVVARPAPFATEPAASGRSVIDRVSPRSLGAAVLVTFGIVALITGVLFIARPPEPGRVLLSTSPEDVVVRLDGKRIRGDQSPYVLSDIVPEQYHVIEVSRAGHRSWHTRLRLQPGQELQLPLVSLPEEPSSSVDAATTPAATAPGTPGSPREALSPSGVERSPGENAAASTKASAKRAPASADKAHRPVARPRPSAPARRVESAATGFGTLRINSRPWSQVSIDGQVIGNTPQMGLRLSAGSHRVVLTNPQFNLRKVLTVQIKPGATETRVVDLQ